MGDNRELIERVEVFQNTLLSYATGGALSEDEFQKLRSELVDDPTVRELLPKFVRTNRDLKQMWAHFKQMSASYQGRREYIWREFRPLLERLERTTEAPADDAVKRALTVLDSDTVHRAWKTAFERRLDDPRRDHCCAHAARNSMQAHPRCR